jgi:hypothetical protein
MIRLSCDSEGYLWLHDDSESSDGCTLLGPIGDARTAGRVPDELAGELERVEEEWMDKAGACKP